MAYTKTYPQNPEYITIKGFEVPIPLPRKPRLSEFRNYGLPPTKQKFYRDEVPADIYEWEPIRYDKFVKEQWHKRKNGEWWLIKGEQVYITGTAWLFFNHWEIENGGYADFRMEAVWWFLVWEFVVNDPNCFGMLDFKGRRQGDTEKALCAAWEMTTRYFSSWFGMQNINEDDAKANFRRVVNANASMPKWFRPVSRGYERPENFIDFRRKTGVAGNEDAPSSGLELKSRIDFKATKLKAYDGKRLRVYHLDEPGKLSPKDMDVPRQWGIVKKCLSLSNERSIVGKALFTSTVEDIANGETVKVCRYLWDGSNPKAKNSVGRTLTGLYRYFRDYTHGWQVDEWGFHDEKAAKAFRDAQIEAYVMANDFDGLASYKHQFPADIEEALAVPAEQCPLYPGLLDMQTTRIRQWTEGAKVFEDNAEVFPVAIRGDFVWTNGFKSNVRFIPNPDSGRFWVSGHPDTPNFMSVDSGILYPRNRGVFIMGIDGIDHKGGTGSDFSMAVFRMFDPKEERYAKWTEGEEGPEVSNKWAMRTNRFVCTYSYRPSHPYEAYEDCLKCVMYYGCPMLAEQNKPGVLRYFEQHKMNLFCDSKPAWVKIGTKGKEKGIHQSSQFQPYWLEEMKMHIYTHIETYTHAEQLAVFRKFTGDNQGDCDQVISSGMALVGARQYAMQLKWAEEVEEEASFPFDIKYN